MSRLILATLAGGFIAGALDIVYICTHYLLAFNVPPTRILQAVAAGWHGREAAVAGGAQTAAIGLASHFFIATGMAGAYVIVSRFVPMLVRQPWICGPLYGLLLYFIMQKVVLPLSNAGDGNAPQGQFLIGALLAHTLLVGLPIALIARALAPASAVTQVT